MHYITQSYTINVNVRPIMGGHWKLKKNTPLDYKMIFHEQGDHTRNVLKT